MEVGELSQHAVRYREVNRANWEFQPSLVPSRAYVSKRVASYSNQTRNFGDLSYHTKINRSGHENKFGLKMR